MILLPHIPLINASVIFVFLIMTLRVKVFTLSETLRVRMK